MTTIACKDGVMACDSCWTDSNDMIGTSKNKIIRLKSGALLGEAGDNDSRAVQSLLQNVKNFEQMPSAIDLAKCEVDYQAVVLFPNGEMAQIMIERQHTAWETYVANAFPTNRSCTAVGSGAHIAVGCMIAGKSAREAVALTCGWDRNSKLPVHTMECAWKPVKTPARRNTRSKTKVRRASSSRPSKAAQ